MIELFDLFRSIFCVLYGILDTWNLDLSLLGLLNFNTTPNRIMFTKINWQRIPLFDTVVAPLADTFVSFLNSILLIYDHLLWKYLQVISLFNSIAVPLSNTCFSLSRLILIILCSTDLETLTSGYPFSGRSWPLADTYISFSTLIRMVLLSDAL